MDKNNSTLQTDIDGLFQNSSRTMVYRTIGGTQSREGIGAGFMSKLKEVDNVNLRFPHYVLVVVMRGTGSYVDAAGTNYLLEAGSCFNRLPGISHSNYIVPDGLWKEFYLEIGPLLYQALSSMQIICDDHPVLKIKLDETLIADVAAFVDDLKNADEEMVPLMTSRMIQLLLECRCRILGSSPKTERDKAIFSDACQYLGTCFTKECDLQRFCRHNGIGYESFRKLFRRFAGVPPWKYRIRRRLDAACSLLANPNISIEQISHGLGYSSQYEFSAQFKRYTGIAPAYFRTGKRDLPGV
jgi:AraC family transcriptional regulator of arabinose operon